MWICHSRYTAWAHQWLRVPGDSDQYWPLKEKLDVSYQYKNWKGVGGGDRILSVSKAYGALISDQASNRVIVWVEA